MSFIFMYVVPLKSTFSFVFALFMSYTISGNVTLERKEIFLVAVDCLKYYDCAYRNAPNKVDLQKKNIYGKNTEHEKAYWHEGWTSPVVAKSSHSHGC